MITKEIKYDDAVVNGFLALFLNLIVLPLLVVVSFMLFKGSIIMFFLLLLFLALAVLMIPGYFSQEPNEARVMVFFGKYKGTFTETGFFWVNPFMNKKKLSLRARNLDVEPIKVNDKIGNPILIGLVLVWKLKDTYKAMFEIDAQTMADNRGSGQMTVTVAGRMNAFEDFVRVHALQSFGGFPLAHLLIGHVGNILADIVLHLGFRHTEIRKQTLVQVVLPIIGLALGLRAACRSHHKQSNGIQ